MVPTILDEQLAWDKAPQQRVGTAGCFHSGICYYLWEMLRISAAQVVIQDPRSSVCSRGPLPKAPKAPATPRGSGQHRSVCVWGGGEAGIQCP